MKRILSLILAVTLLLTGIPFFAGQQTSALTYNNLEYEVSGSTISITGGSPIDGLLEIPSSIDGKPVTYIGSHAFSNNQDITSLILPESVTMISDFTFSECHNLKTANLKGVRQFGISPFYNCFNLLSVKFTKNYNTTLIISNDLFGNCYNLNSVYFYTSPSNSLDLLFKSCSDGLTVFYSNKTSGWNDYLIDMKKVPFNPDLKYTVTYDPNGAESGTVPVDGNSYEPSTFYTVADNTGNLTKSGTVFLGWNTNPDGTSVDHYAGDTFDIETGNVVLYAMWDGGRDSGETLEWYNNGITWMYTQLGDEYCTIDNAEPAVGDLVIPAVIDGRKVINISDYAFYNCSELTSVTLPDNTTGIGSLAFGGCTGITSLTIPSGNAYVADDAFLDSENLASIIVDHSNAYYSSYKGVLYNKQKTVLENCPTASSECIILPTADTVASGAFATCNNIASLTLPSNITKIEDYAFYYSEVKFITLSENVNEIGDLAFYSSYSLIEIDVNVQNQLYSSKEGILYDKNQTTLIVCPSSKTGMVNVPDTTTQINATGLIESYNIAGFQVGAANTAFSSQDDILFNKSKTALIKCPVLKSGDYTVPSTVTDIKDDAFVWCMDLTNIVLPSGLKTIGLEAFMGCMGLNDIIIPASVISISDNAFSYDDLLADAYFQGNAPQMGEGVFDYCNADFSIHYNSNCTGFTTPTWLTEEYPTIPNASTVSFNSMGGSAVVSKTAAYNTVITAPAAPTRSGYIFAGWFTSTAFTTPWVFASSKVTANITLYAKWIASQVTGLKVLSAGYNSIKLTWSPTSGANYYEIYRASSLTGTYYLVTTIAATSVPTYTSTALGTGTTYYFKVRAYSLGGTTKTYNNYSTISSTKPLPATPTGLTAFAASYSSTKLSWTAVAGASGYSVYRATSSTGTYSLIATVTTNTYTKTALTTGSTYYYKVNAYRLVGTTKVYGSQCAAIGAKVVPSTPTSLAATSPSYNSLKLTWAGVYGANGYSVYRSTSATGTYALLATVTTNSYTNINLAPGTSYYYKVNAYRLVGTTKVYGSLCAAVGRKVVPSTISTLTVARYSATSIKLNWGAISGASGYEIYRSTSATGTYTLVTTLTAISYINTSLITGTTYYYKVRAYRLIGATKVYADFSALKYAKP